VEPTLHSLVKKAQKGDDTAFYELMQGHKEQLYRIAFSYVKNEADAVEAIQELTFRAYKQLRKLNEPSYFSTWLIRILINYCIDEQRRRKRVVIELTKEESHHDEELSSKLEMKRVLGKLKANYQHVVILKYLHDLTVPEIAKVLERPEGTIKTWLHKALLEMRTMMEREDYYV
jgi:RNA polymerase sigma-70 factor (TIGR02954 family)